MNEVAENVEVEEMVENESTVEAVEDDEVVQAFRDGVDQGKDKDAVLISMLQAGAKFSKVRKIYEDLMIRFGYALSAEDKNSVIESAIEGVDISTEGGLTSAIEHIVSSIEGTNERGAGTMIRFYARKNGLEYFIKPKSEGTGRVSFVKSFYKALVDNPKMTEQEVRDFIAENGTEKTIKSEKAYQDMRLVCNTIANKYAS